MVVGTLQNIQAEIFDKSFNFDYIDGKVVHMVGDLVDVNRSVK